MKSTCEWKGAAQSFHVRAGDRTAVDAVWSYPEPFAEYAVLAGWLAFHPGRLDSCRLDGEEVHPQEGEYYGGWISRELVGPWKGAPGTEDW